MDPKEIAALDASIQERIGNDGEFQTSIAAMSEEDKAKAVEAKRVEILKTDAIKNGKLAGNYKTRAEKAEDKLKNGKGKDDKKAKDDGSGKGDEDDDDSPAPKEDELSQMDLRAIIKADVHDDDVQEVRDYAKLKGVSVADALKSSVVKGILAQNTEFRKTAEAAKTGAPTATTKVKTDEALLADLSKGEIPEPGSKEAEDLFWAKRGGRRE